MSSNMPASLANGRYQLGQLVGRGGMAEVRVALDTRLGRTVAIKIMRADLANVTELLLFLRRNLHPTWPTTRSSCPDSAAKRTPWRR